VSAEPLSSDAVASSPAPRAERNPGWEGMSLLAFSGIALLAFLGARGLAPSLPGTRVGLDRAVDYASFASACLSQLVAAGGIALCLRLTGGLLSQPALGLSYRLALIPTAFGVMALVAAAVTRPLGAGSSTWLLLAAFAAPAATLPFLFSQHRLRPLGLASLAFCSAALLDLLSYAVLHRAPFGSVGSSWFTLICANLALLLDAAGVALAVTFASGSERAPVSIWLGGSTLLLAVCGWAGFGFGGSASLPHRLLGALARQSPFEYSHELAEFVAVLLITGAAALLTLSVVRAEVRAALCLCLTARLSAGTPVSALLSVCAALLLAYVAMNPHATHQGSAPKKTKKLSA